MKLGIYHLFTLLIFVTANVDLSFSQPYADLRNFLFLNDAINLADQKLEKTLEEISFHKTVHPAHTDTVTGEWITFDRNEWTSGFFAGTLWFMYQLTGEEKWQEYAQKWTHDMKSTAYKSSDHDVGFRIVGSYGNGFKLTDQPEYLKIILQGAYSLSKRYNPDIGAVKSWDPWTELNAVNPVIIDNLMNLELLFLAAKHSGRNEWKDIAITHANTTIEHHLRQDGSTYHIVDFNKNGSVNRKFTIQGYDKNSVWSRGQAWAIYGFTMAYRYTKNPDFLKAATTVADYFLENLPVDHVPWYDFREPAIPNTTKDASAAAIASSGLIELYSFTNNPDYFNNAVDILNSLMSDEYSSKQTDDSSILLRSTIHRGDSERGTIYADYYFLEAIIRYKNQIESEFPYLETQSFFQLGQNYPNPFNNQTQFYYSVENAGNVNIDLYNLAGRKIKTLFSGFREPGSYLIQVNASNLASGFYIYAIQSHDMRKSKKMLLIQ
ncbi:MAG: glycoside hydrolase family 88 protein [Balneolaceae bacterium]|nr:glycoside hydrolase family 88 protein [Balneolaceae bacterium]